MRVKQAVSLVGVQCTHHLRSGLSKQAAAQVHPRKTECCTQVPLVASPRPTGATQRLEQGFDIQPRHPMPIAFGGVGGEQGIDDGFFHGFGGGQEQLADVIVVDHAQVVGGRCILALVGGRRHVFIAGGEGDEDIAAVVFIAAAVLGLSLGRSTRFSLEEQGRLPCVRDWVLAAMRRHLDLQPPQGPVAEPPASDLVTLLDRFDARLTVREIETARLILQGFSSKAIAQQMGISPETVKVHRRNLYHKLNVNGHGELFALVVQPR